MKTQFKLLPSICLSVMLPILGLGAVTSGCDTEAARTLAGKATVTSCQESCDKQRFFDCYDAAQHGGCYDDCASADNASIDKFNGCVDNTICDAECSVHIEGRSADVPAEERVDTGRTPQQSSSNCDTACAAMVADMCVPEDCSQLCSDTDFAFTIVYCNNVRNGCEFPAECTGEVAPVDACKDGCQQMQFFDCLGAADAIKCNQACDTVDDSTRTLFADCVDGSGTCDAACYTALDPSGPSADVAGCQDACDKLAFFDCVDGSTQSACRNLCMTASRSSAENLKSCSEGLCEDSSCYDTFVAENP